MALQSSFYPSIRSTGIQRAIAAYPKELKAFFGGAAAFDLSTGRGYLQVELFSLVVPALLTIAAIAFGAATIAGEQERGTLDFLLACPLTRGRVVLEKALGAGVTVGALSGVVFIVIVGLNPVDGLGVGVGNLAAACIGAALVAYGFGLTAMLAGAASGSRGVAIGVAAALFVTSYLVTGLAQLVSWLEPARELSPLFHATGTQPLEHGFPVANLLGLAGLVRRGRRGNRGHVRPSGPRSLTGAVRTTGRP